MEKFEEVIRKMISLFEELKIVEQKKLESVQKNRITFLEDSMNKEQACILKLRGLEQERERIQKENGWENKKFRQILEIVSEEEKKQLEPLFLELSKKIKEFQAINEDACALIQVNLHKVNAALAQNGARYTEDRHLENRKKPFTSRRV